MAAWMANDEMDNQENGTRIRSTKDVKLGTSTRRRHTITSVYSFLNTESVHDKTASIKRSSYKANVAR